MQTAEGSRRFLGNKGLTKKRNTRDIQGAGKGPGKALGRVSKVDTEVCGVQAVGGVCPSLRGLCVVRGAF